MYEGQFDTPKTDAGVREVHLATAVKPMVAEWRERSGNTKPEDLVFATRSGKPISPNNVLRRWVYPACDALEIRRVNWLTCRRTFATWGDAKRVPPKVMAQMLGHKHVSTTMDIYTQVLDGAARDAAEVTAQNCSRLSLTGTVEGP